MFDLDLTDTQTALLETVSRTCAKFEDAYWTRHEQKRLFPHEFFKAMTDIGVVGVLVPREYDGSGKLMESSRAIGRSRRMAGWVSQSSTRSNASSASAACSVSPRFRKADHELHRRESARLTEIVLNLAVS